MQEMEINYSVPRDLLEKFAVEAQQNKCINGGGHNETLAFVTGHWLQNKIVAQDLIFPKQRGSSTEVEDLGKNYQTMIYKNLSSLFIFIFRY